MKKTRKKYEELTIMDDFMFGKVMRNPKHCKKLLELILNVKIRKIEFLDDQQTVNPDYTARGIRLDVYVEDDTDRVYSVEMQARNTGELPMRSRYYQSAVDMNLIEKGVDYRLLKKNYVIFICTFDLFDKGRAIYRFENLCREEPTLRLRDGTEKIFLNTKGIRDIGNPLDDIDEELRRLLDYFESLVPQDAFTGELDEAVAAAKAHKEWRREYMTLERMMLDSRREGRDEGRAEGKVEAVLELLSDLGELTDVLKKRIHQETDPRVLTKWLKAAARAESVAEFESEMDFKS